MDNENMSKKTKARLFQVEQSAMPMLALIIIRSLYLIKIYPLFSNAANEAILRQGQTVGENWRLFFSKRSKHSHPYICIQKSSQLKQNNL